MRRLLRSEGLVPAAGVLVFLLVFGLLGGADDSAPEARWLGLGVLAAPAIMAYVHRWAAACAALLAVVVWMPLAAGAPTVLLLTAYAGIAVIVARRDRTARPVSVLRRPPAPAGLPHVAVPGEVIGLALLVLAAVAVVLIVLGVVALPWLAAAVAGSGLGGALLARTVSHRAALRRLFGTPQPVHEVRAVEQVGYVHVLLPGPDGRTAREFAFDVADRRPTAAGPQPTTTAPRSSAGDSRPAGADPRPAGADPRPAGAGPRPAGDDTADQGPSEDDEPVTRPGLLYGTPTPGAWCAVEVEGRLHVPVGPVGPVITVPYDVVQHLPREVEDDEEQLVDPAALRDGDRGLDAVDLREHRIAPQRAWVATVAIGLGAGLGCGELAHLAGVPDGPVALCVVLASAAGYEFGWRSQLRPRLRWHAGGVAAVGFRGRDRQPWATDSAVLHDDTGTVVLTAGESVLTVPAPPPWPSPAAQRSAEQLVAALREARAQSFELSPVPPPPQIDVPGRPLLLAAAWLATVAVSLLILG